MLLRHTAVALLCFSLLSPNKAALAQQPSRLSSPSQTPPTGIASPQSITKGPDDPIDRIKDEGINRSQVMRTLDYLTEGIGPRLTNSPNMRRANEWTRDQLRSWGLQNVHLEAWGPFGRGWSLKRFSAQITEPQNFPLTAYPKAWSPGTSGTLVADVIFVDAKSDAELQKFKGRLKGAIVLTGSARNVKANFEPLARRQTEKELLTLANAPDPSLTPAQRFQPTAEQREVGTLTGIKYQFFAKEGAVLLVDPSADVDGGAVSWPTTPSQKYQELI